VPGYDRTVPPGLSPFFGACGLTRSAKFQELQNERNNNSAQIIEANVAQSSAIL
jgi:hypothetical protein